MRAVKVIAAAIVGTAGTAAAWLDQQPLDKTLHGPGFTKQQQGDFPCSTYGEKQWTGTVNVGAGRDLFYWFFHSRNDPSTDPVIVWMNGGPGASSTLGLFNELGPCRLLPHGDASEPNPWAWNNNASLLFLDQPAGAGFSHLADGLPLAAREEDTMDDFQRFLDVFFADVFPDMRHLPIHIAAESYGGHYGPVYLHHILQSRRYDSRHAFHGNITSLILVDAVIEFTGPFVGMYEFFCEDDATKGIINATACDGIAKHLPELQRLGDSCRRAYTEGPECTAGWEYADKYINAAYKDEVAAGRNPMNINKTCTPGDQWLDCKDDSLAAIDAYLNRHDVKEALGKDESFTFDPMGRRFFTTFSGSGALFKPTTRELVDVLEEGIKVLVMNGNLDPLVTTPGTKWQYDRLRWSEQAEYAAKRWQTLNGTVKGEWKATSSGSLAMVTVDGAGHMVPGDMPEAAFRVLETWMAGGWRM